MSEKLRTMADVEKDINNNYRQLKEARKRNEKDLVGLFEYRMNGNLDEYGDFCCYMGDAALGQELEVEQNAI